MTTLKRWLWNVAAGLLLVWYVWPVIPLEAQATLKRGWATVTAPLLLVDGSSSAPALSFINDTLTGFYRSSVAVVIYAGNGSSNLRFGNGINLRSDGQFGFVNTTNVVSGTLDTYLTRGAAGVLNFTGATSGTGLVAQFNGTPTVASGFGTTPSVVTGSTDSAGGVYVGSTTSNSGVITFASTWTRAPFCAASIKTQVAGSTRAVGCVASTTQLTLVPETAFAASTTATWVVLGGK